MDLLCSKKYLKYIKLVILWKQSLNSEGQQFYQYQQNEQSPLILTELVEHKKTTAYYVGNPGPGLWQAQQYCGFKPVNGIPTLPSWLVISSTAMHIYKMILKHAHIRPPPLSKRPRTITKMKDNINMDSTINARS
jgi:hypothetical protein